MILKFHVPPLTRGPDGPKKLKNILSRRNLTYYNTNEKIIISPCQDLPFFIFFRTINYGPCPVVSSLKAHEMSKSLDLS